MRASWLSAIQTGFTTILILFFIGVSAWSIRSIVNQDGQAGPVQQQAAPAPVTAPEPAPQPRRTNAGDNWYLDSPP